MPRRSPAALAATLSFCALAASAHAQSYRIVELPTLGASSVARDINDAGIIVGSSRRIGSALDRPVKWEGGQISDLDPQNWFGTGSATAIDNQGRIALGVATPLSCFPAGAMLLNPDEPWNPLSFPAADGTQAMPCVIAGESDLLGCVKTTTTGALTAARWNTPWSTSTALLGTTTASEAAGMNASGAIVGWRIGSAPSSLYPSAASDRAFIKIGSQITDLPTTGNRLLSAASAITDSGLIVGSVFSNRALCVPQIKLNALPTKWVNNTPALLPMPGSNTMGAALDANARGEIIGQLSGDPFQSGPVVWRGSTPIVLRTHLLPGHQFVRLDTISAINASGQIVGSGIILAPNNVVRNSAFVATPCYADFNANGAITTTDIFDYLNAFFAGDARADIGGTPGTTTSDIFDFVTAWFTGCN